MTLIGVDLHTREQSIAKLDITTGEVQEIRLRYERDEVERFYASLPPPVTVAATGQLSAAQVRPKKKSAREGL